MLLLCPLLSRYQTHVRRRGREAEGTRLLNERAPKGHRGFESLRLRQFFDFYVMFQLLVVSPESSPTFGPTWRVWICTFVVAFPLQAV